ncbi:hypothetical protein PYCCODRAFT_1427042 [Trametes coccinea BRFM310]|uniref:Uncharacterized protein n=1 Tax=Trametes coccinea (strain BRFM310) TaxID=1353009 RepID=A0A1Y2IGS9_TRAC3|nr:hypothetical protein PYCCODRAFT_1427042 [Trametes coccinea BRFM310]
MPPKLDPIILNPSNDIVNCDNVFNQSPDTLPIPQKLRAKLKPAPERNLHRDIALLTHALKTVRKGASCTIEAALASKNLSAEKRTEFVTFGHISTLLTAGHPKEDPLVTKTVNAVTGRADLHKVTMLCTTNEASELGIAQTAIQSVSVDISRGRELLAGWANLQDLPKHMFFNIYVKELGSILAYIWSEDCATELDRDFTATANELLFSFSSIITSRARTKIVGRINNLKKLWDGESPITIMRNFFKEHPEETTKTPHTVLTFPYIQPCVTKFLSDNNLHPDLDNPLQYTFSSSNVLDWIDALQKTMSNIVQTLRDSDCAPSREQTVAGQAAIQTLHTLLRSNLCNILQQYAGANHALRLGYTGTKSANNVSDLNNNNTDDDSDPDDSVIFILPKKGVHTIRQVDIYTVKHVPTFTVKKEDIQPINQRLNKLHSTLHTTVPDTTKEYQTHTKVHAEAALMALAWLHRQGQTAQFPMLTNYVSMLDTIFSYKADEYTIGASGCNWS